MKKVIALATRVECNKEGKCIGGKSDKDKGGERVMAIRAMMLVTATTWAMVMAKRVAGNEEGNGNCGKSDGNGSKGGGQATAMRVMAMATATATTWAMASATRLAGNKEGKAEGSKGNGDSDEGGGQQRG
jgi:hypothetical protein